MSVLEAIFLFLCVYVVVDIPIMIVSALRGKDVRGRVIIWIIALVAAVVIGLIMTSSQGQVLT